jgi:uncharacterized membrane protein
VEHFGRAAFYVGRGSFAVIAVGFLLLLISVILLAVQKKPGVQPPSVSR